MAGTWASMNDLISARNGTAQFGSSSAGAVVGGHTTYSSVKTDATLIHNGTSWSAGGLISAACSNFSGCGTISAGLVAGGIESSAVKTTRIYNGTSWINGNNLNVNRSWSGIVGSTSAARANANGGAVANTENFNGTSWSNSTAYSQTRNLGVGGFGTQSSCGIIGGYNSGALQLDTELWNGTTWSSSGDISYGGFYFMGGGGGTQSFAWYCGGTPADESSGRNTTEEFNGSTWSVGGNMSVARRFNSWSCNGNNGFTAGGSTTSYATLTATAEKYTISGGDPPAASTNMKINIGDTFKDVSELKLNVGDTWKSVTKVQINIGDVWKTVFESGA